MSNDSSAVSLPPPTVTPAPWGLLGTIVWGAAGVCAWFAVQFAVIVAVIVWRDSTAPGTVDMQKMANDGFLLAFITIVQRPRGSASRCVPRDCAAGPRATIWRSFRRAAARSWSGSRVWPRC